MNKENSNNPNWKGGNDTKICIVCNQPYPITRRKREQKRRFCSHACRGKYFSGPMNGNWLGEKGKNRDHNERQRTITCQEYLTWRKNIIDRDGWVCLCCGNKNNLVAHHLKCYWDYPEERFVMDNGITVCRSCHTNIHLNKVLFVKESSETNTLGFFVKTKDMIESELVGDYKRLCGDVQLHT